MKKSKKRLVQEETVKKVAVLFCTKKSVYKRINGCDVYDEERNALTFRGDQPVIAHPPCRKFSRLWHMSTAPEKEKQLAYWTLRQVRKNGGVLEHPAHSKLWEVRKLPLPGAQADQYGGWTLSIPQFWFGHRAQKETWLYIVGCARKDIPAPMLQLGEAQFKVSGSISAGRRAMGWKEKPCIKKWENNATPPAFADWLIELALRCKRRVA